MIEIRNLTFTYPDGRKAIEGINLNIHASERVGLIGPNGAGKSTLLLHLNGIYSGYGDLKVNGLEVIKKNHKQIRSIVGIVFQNPDDQLFSTTVFEDVAYGPIYQGLNINIIQERVNNALMAVSMIDYIDRIPLHLSVGEKKRIAIASVLSMHPEILVLDEPSAGLDPRSRRELMELLYDLPQTMVIASHDLDLVNKLTDRSIILYGGKIVADGQTKEILSNLSLLDKYELL
ncbi:MAG: ATP-binding cassette domain-containing protein [Anaerolineaceae bacterium]|nr:ATP-binding cassette domain-containing protein [Anaerolineaceae bacterium]